MPTAVERWNCRFPQRANRSSNWGWFAYWTWYNFIVNAELNSISIEFASRYSLTKYVNKLNCQPSDRIWNCTRHFHWKNWPHLWSQVSAKTTIVLCRIYWSICYASNIKWKISFGQRDRAVWLANFNRAANSTFTLTMRWFTLPIRKFHTVTATSLCVRFSNSRNWIVGCINWIIQKFRRFLLVGSIRICNFYMNKNILPSIRTCWCLRFHW